MLKQSRLEERISTIRELLPEARKGEIYINYVRKGCIEACMRTAAKALSGKTVTLDEKGVEYEYIGFNENVLYFLQKGFTPKTKRQKEDWVKFRNTFGQWDLKQIRRSVFCNNSVIDCVYADFYNTEKMLRFLRTGYLTDSDYTTLHYLPVESLDPVQVELAVKYLDSYISALAEYEKPHSVIEKYIEEINADIQDNLETKYGKGKSLRYYNQEGIPSSETYTLALTRADYWEHHKDINLTVILLQDCDKPTAKEQELIKKFRNSDSDDDKYSYLLQLKDLKNALMLTCRYSLHLYADNIVNMLQSLNFKEFKVV